MAVRSIEYGETFVNLVEDDVVVAKAEVVDIAYSVHMGDGEAAAAEAAWLDGGEIVAPFAAPSCDYCNDAGAPGWHCPACGLGLYDTEANG